ncbi:hypothetical protein [Rhodococcus koreensis]|uniref:hypothetical protein n=1 Tax=Rhodococcus koreensis TaxID=99653 RepID=UPI0036717D84
MTVLVMRKSEPETTNEQRSEDPIDAASINIAPTSSIAWATSAISLSANPRRRVNVRAAA